MDVDESNTDERNQDTTADANVQIGENKKGGELGNTNTTNDNDDPKTEQLQGNEQNDDKNSNGGNGRLTKNAENTANLRGRKKQTVSAAK